jgi:hypothetical protein
MFKYNIGQNLISEQNSEKIKVIDRESILGVNIYYFNNQKSFAEFQVKPLLFNFLQKLFSMSNDEKNKEINKVLIELENDLKLL